MLLGIDTGGTYTDAVLFDQDKGVLKAAKALTTKHDLAIGVGGAMAKILPEDPSQIRLVALSTTLATNALVEAHGSPVCLLLIGYDRNALERAGLGQALGRDPIAFIDGGHSSSGEAKMDLDLEAARAAIRDYASKVSAFVVAGYFSVRNPDHEVRLRELIREETGLPVTCAHELTSNLDAPRRAMTAVLNGRLIPLLQGLILSVEQSMASARVAAPLMVVKGDGSLISAEAALTRPIETILSGPAASVVGARYLTGADNVVVSDIGGTTTDVALLRNGKPRLNLEGARVGGWRTMVEAVAVHTYGIGGDSEVRLDDNKQLVVGPRRAMPLALLCQEHGSCLDSLKAQAARKDWDEHAGRFALRLRPLDSATDSLSSGERKVWEALESGPIALSDLLVEHHLARPLQRLCDRGLVIVSAFTPSDASHVLGRQDTWSAEAARLGAELWGRTLAQRTGWTPASPAEFADRVVDQLVVQTGKALISTALVESDGTALEDGGPLGRALVEKALRTKRVPDQDGLSLSVSLDDPLVAIGAPAETYYHDVADRLTCELIVPTHAGVTNAVGAVASGVSQAVKALITAPSEEIYRVHIASGVRDFRALEPAVAFAEQEARLLAESQAREAGADAIEIETRRRENVVDGPAGDKLFIECEIVATAVGRPRLGDAPAIAAS